LAKILRRNGFQPFFALDRHHISLPIEVPYPIEWMFDCDHEYWNVQLILDLLVRLKSSVIIVDSYRITKKSIQLLRDSKIFVIVIDDLDLGGDANLRIDYSPNARRLPGSAESFLGPAYFITDISRRPVRTGPPRKAILHAGGTGNFAAAVHAYVGATRASREKGLELSWLVPNECAKIWLSNSGLVQEADIFVDWHPSRCDLWSGFDIVIGPASTSLYESILQGSLPISFSISPTQSSARDPWLKLGHTLHATMEEITDSSTVEELVYLAVSKYDTLRGLLTYYSTDLDEFGANRVVIAICNLLDYKYFNQGASAASELIVRKCDIRDSLNFLASRNAWHVRAFSTFPSHIISWPEHIAWWLTIDTERFMLVGASGTEAFFWHRSLTVDDRDYLIGGWFPTASKLAFTTAIKVLDWQLNFCDDNYPRHIWVATINVKNSSVLMLNRRYGFTEPDARTKAVIQNLFPGTNDNFVILQRKTKLS